MDVVYTISRLFGRIPEVITHTGTHVLPFGDLNSTFRSINNPTSAFSEANC
jgi:hypothetical protein